MPNARLILPSRSVIRRPPGGRFPSSVQPVSGDMTQRRGTRGKRGTVEAVLPRLCPMTSSQPR